jgi:hypothetical protein
MLMEMPDRPGWRLISNRGNFQSGIGFQPMIVANIGQLPMPHELARKSRAS